jgi:lysophospholipase L1-like esterase
MPRIFSALLAAIAVISLAFAVYLLIRPPSSPHRPPVILCLGDSMTEGGYGGYPVHLRRLVKTKFPRVRVYAAARPGHNTREYAAFLRNSDVLRKYRPDIVLLMLGTNDARTDGDKSSLNEFRQEMNRIVDMIRAGGVGKYRGPGAIFIATLPPIFSIDLPNFSEESRRRIVGEINPAIRRLARERNLNLVDVERLFRENRDLLPGIHPSAAGFRRMAETFFAAIRPDLRSCPAD